MNRDPKIIVVSKVTGVVVSRSTWSEWAIDNGECISIIELSVIADQLRNTGESTVNDHLLIACDFVPEAIPAA